MFNSKLKKEKDRLTELSAQQKEKIDKLNAAKDKLVEVNVQQSEKINMLSTTIEENNAYTKTVENLIVMDIEELRKQPNNFPRPILNKETGFWETTTAFCSLGGCEYRYFSNSTEREALQRSVFATLKGQEVDSHGTCSTCYSEYMRDTI